MSDRGHLPLTASADPRPGRSRHAGGMMTGGIEHVDFGVRNTLLYYKDLKATLDLTPGAGAHRGAVERLLGGERVPLSDFFDPESDAMRGAVKRVRSISYRARRDTDKGTPGTLCVAWGLASWDNGRSTLPAAPIVLRQASVGRHAGTAENFDLMVSGPWNLNMTLLRLLEVDFDVDVDVERRGLGDLAEELSGHGDPEVLFGRIAKMAAQVPGFTVAPRVVMAPVPRVAMVVHRLVDPPPVATIPVASHPSLTAAEPDDEATPADETSDDRNGETTADIVDLLTGGVLNPKTLAEGSLERRIADKLGPDAVIADITTTLRRDSWPEALIEHADSGLRVRDRAELLQRWYEASAHRPRPTRWDATHFALWGLAAAPPAGTPAIESVARWGERRQHPILMTWQLVAQRRAGSRRRGRLARTMRVRSRRVVIPRGLDAALWGLPVDLLEEWAAWVFRLWPGAPMEYVLPEGTPELVSAWYERARPVAELAVKTWVPFSGVDNELGKARHRWSRQLTNACAGGGAPLATWFEASAAVATEAVAVRLGDKTVAGRRGGRRSVTSAEHAV